MIQSVQELPLVLPTNTSDITFLNDELTYLQLISDEILYIIDQNCKDSYFGHCDFALELFDFFVEIWNAKIRLIENYSKTENSPEAKEKKNRG